MKRFRQNWLTQQGQQMIEYLLVMVVVIVALIGFVGPLGPFRGAVNRVIDQSLDEINREAQLLDID